MLRDVSNIALLHIKLVVSDRRVFFFSLLLPVLFTALMGNAKLAGTGGARSSAWQISVVNEDRGALGRHLISGLEEDPLWKVSALDRRSASDSVRRDRAVALFVPADFTERISGGRPVVLELRASRGAAQKARIAEQSVDAALARLAALIDAANASVRMIDGLGSSAEPGEGPSAEARRQTYFDAGLSAAEVAWKEFSPVVIEGATPGESPAARQTAAAGVNQSSPGMLVMFALFFIVGGTNILIIERRRGTLRRLLVMPTSKSTILLGKLLGIYVTGITQMGLLILADALLFKVNWGRSPAALALMVLSFSLVATGLGAMLATIARTTDQADALASIVVMAASALGGAWWPLDHVPGWMRTLGHAFPTAWAMDGFHDIIIRGLEVGAVLPEIGVLLGFAVLFLSVSIKRFRYE